MRLIPIMLAASIGTAVAEDNKQYDDPAVAICETTLKPNLHPQAQYSRKSAAIVGSTVTILYSISILNTKPENKEFSCTFKLENDKYKFDDPPLEPKNCDVYLARMDEIMKLKELDPVRVTFTKDLGECANKLKRNLKIFNSRFADRDLPLIMTGIYPIDPAKTSLKAP